MASQERDPNSPPSKRDASSEQSPPLQDDTDNDTDENDVSQSDPQRDKKRSSKAAEVSEEDGEAMRDAKREKKTGGLSKGETFATTAEKDAERTRQILQSDRFPRKDSRKGSDRVAIVCKDRCAKRFLVSDWAEPWRHYLKDSDENGQRVHQNRPFDHTQFKYMSIADARKRQARIEDQRNTDDPSEIDSDVGDKDYHCFNSLPGRPGVVIKQIKACSKTLGREKDQDGADDAAGEVTSDAQASEESKAGTGKTPKTQAGTKGKPSGVKPGDSLKKCAMMREAVAEAQTHIVRLHEMLQYERKARAAEISRLCFDTNTFMVAPGLASNPLSNQRVTHMLNDMPRGDDLQTTRYLRQNDVLPTTHQVQQAMFPNPGSPAPNAAATIGANDSINTPTTSDPYIDPALLANPTEHPSIARRTFLDPNLGQRETIRRVDWLRESFADTTQSIRREEAVRMLEESGWDEITAAGLWEAGWRPSA